MFKGALSLYFKCSLINPQQSLLTFKIFLDAIAVSDESVIDVVSDSKLVLVSNGKIYPIPGPGLQITQKLILYVTKPILCIFHSALSVLLTQLNPMKATQTTHFSYSLSLLTHCHSCFSRNSTQYVTGTPHDLLYTRPFRPEITGIKCLNESINTNWHSILNGPSENQKVYLGS